MTTHADTVNPGRLARSLAVLSVLCFWLLPFSPAVAIGAVSTTRGASGWTRRLAVAGAWLCVAYTALMTGLFLRAAMEIRW
ncbi:hypothetical protein OJF2_09790 [Aquisphaera giovannonii]|uniref:Uncharacterized protein n=1 Tax=Aquisphaera giovannonii TaxID=406548 RepID=A0A5B9VW96_9BACT|nr:hypothetical protein [Aquisphaera giovannonii]QEH32502.1 hypothetical protein OJF2_09790 [Aquisphaera giovannonii]